MENCISCGHVKSRHYDALGTGCKETPAGFPCRCEGYIPCPSCAALRAEVERLREVIERNGEMLRLKDIDIDALRAEVDEWKSYGTSEHNAARKAESRLALLEKVADIPDDSWKLITEFHNAVLKGAEVFGSPTKGTRYFFTLYEVVAKLRAALDAAKEGK